jgi:hypothetical protein
MHIVYWARLALARQPIIAALRALPGCDLTVAESLSQLLAALPAAEGLVTHDAPPAEATQVAQAMSQSGSRSFDGCTSCRLATKASTRPVCRLTWRSRNRPMQCRRRLRNTRWRSCSR